MKMLNVFEVVPENCVRIISNVRLFVLGSCLHDKSSLWITPTPPPRPEARGAFTNEYPLGVIAAIIALSEFFVSHVSVIANISML